MPEKNPSRPVESATAAPGEKRAASPRLSRASESGNGEVQQLLGVLDTARLNLAAADKESVTDQEAEASRDAAVARLRELGYE